MVFTNTAQEMKYSSLFAEEFEESMPCLKTEAILAVLGNGPNSLHSQSNICMRIDSRMEDTPSLLKNLLGRR